ncbi:MAG: choice-of-anchor L domain-containing protein [Pirellulaceae bacterium]
MQGTVNLDAAAIEFQVIVKRRGVLIVDLVFGSDEFPSYNATVVNDFPMIIVQRIDQPQPSVNLIKFTKQVGTNAPTVRPLTLDDIDRCPTTFFKQNRPEPATYQQALGGAGYDTLPETYYDHELCGFTKVLTRDIKLDPGTYRIKICVADCSTNPANGWIDSALFVPNNGVRFFSLADYNNNGVVDAADYTVWKDSFGQSVPPGTGADGNVNGVIDAADYTVWKDDFGLGYFAEDFNRDGKVDDQDRTILLEYLPPNWNTPDPNGVYPKGLKDCASRAEGDATADGEIDRDDVNAYNLKTSGSPIQ